MTIVKKIRDVGGFWEGVLGVVQGYACQHRTLVGENQQTNSKNFSPLSGASYQPRVRFSGQWLPHILRIYVHKRNIDLEESRQKLLGFLSAL